MEDYEQKYEEFWQEIVENPDGSINMDQLKRELFDFSTLMHNISLVYEHVTGGMISKPLTDPDVVIQQADDFYNDICLEECNDQKESWEIEIEALESELEYWKNKTENG